MTWWKSYTLMGENQGLPVNGSCSCVARRGRKMQNWVLQVPQCAVLAAPVCWSRSGRRQQCAGRREEGLQTWCIDAMLLGYAIGSYTREPQESVASPSTQISPLPPSPPNRPSSVVMGGGILGYPEHLFHIFSLRYVFWHPLKYLLWRFDLWQIFDVPGWVWICHIW